MKTTVIHEKNAWNKWTDAKLQALENAKSNVKVGGKIVFENDEFLVWSIHLPQGETVPFHKHCKRYFWTALSAGKSKSYHNDGSISETEYEQGDTKYFDDLNEDNLFIHNLENIGDTTLVFTTVEFKR